MISLVSREEAGSLEDTDRIEVSCSREEDGSSEDTDRIEVSCSREEAGSSELTDGCEKQTEKKILAAVKAPAQRDERMVTEYAAYTCEGNTVTLYRLYGMDPMAEIPAIIDGKVVERCADHLFAREMSVMCPVEQMSLAAFHSDGWVRILPDDYPSSIPEMEKMALCQDRVESIRIPEGVKQIGNYAFYGLYRLREISFPSSISRIGWGMFNGCGKIERLIFHLPSGEMTLHKKSLCAGAPGGETPCQEAPGGETLYEESCEKVLREHAQDTNALIEGTPDIDMLSEKELTPPVMKEVLDALSGEVDAIVMQGDRELYRLRFPEYYEEGKENTPARIIEIVYHGTGHQYRNCFLSRVLQFERYDDIFPLAAAQESLQTNVNLILNRLRSGPEPRTEALTRYLSYLGGHNEAVTEMILSDEEFDPVPVIMMLDDKNYYNSTYIDESIRMASRAGCAAVVSCLMDIRNRRFKTQKRSRYEL